MTKPVIAVDIDEVLAASAEEFVAYSNKHWGLHLTIEDYHEHWSELWQVDKEETNRRAAQFNNSDELKSVRHFDDAVAVLNRLKDRFELVIATARRQELAPMTRAWIEERYSGVFSGIHHAGIWETEHVDANTFTKAELCQKIGANFLIDDQIKHCVGVSECGVTALLFGDYGWNKHQAVPDTVVRVANWQEVADYFERVVI